MPILPNQFRQPFTLETFAQTVDYEVTFDAIAPEGDGRRDGPNYLVTFRYEAGPDRGIFTFTLAGKAIGSVDTYAEKAKDTSTSFPVTIAPGFLRRVDLEVTGKNDASTGYRCVFAGVDFSYSE